MSSRTRVRQLQRSVAMLLMVTLVLSQTSVAWAGNFNRNGAVGGISINADGVVATALIKDRQALVREMRAEIKTAAGEMAKHVELRKISLKQLEAACAHYLAHNAGQLPDELKYLGGLQRVEYVMVYPELNDIVIAGPAENWKVDDAGNVVGVTTGRPVLHLDDLLVAMRTVRNAQQVGISVSIEPTAEGYRNLNTLLEQQKRNRTQPGPQLEAAMKNAFGPQQVKLNGVPATSHFARVLVAADYKMKRLAMKLEASPVKGLPSFVDLVKNARSSNVNPRWWMACNYEPVVASNDGLVFQLQGPGVKVMTENDFVAEDGSVTATGKADPTAQKWANLMTQHYAELSEKDIVFGELRNLMDLCVIAALIDKNDLMTKAGCSLPLLTGVSHDLLIDTWNAPKQVAPECSFVKTRAGWLVTASGGVQIESFDVASRTVVSDDMGEVRTSSMGVAGHAWWWN